MVDMHPELARALLDDLPAGLVLLDQADRIVWANRAMGVLLDQSVSDLTGQSADALPLSLPKEGDERTGPASTGASGGRRLVGMSCPMATSYFSGRALLVVDRGPAADSFLKSLPRGMPNGSVNAGVLGSREAIRHRLEVEISRSRRYENPLSCLIIRLAYPVNASAKDDTDAIFKEAVRIAKEQLRWVDVLGQWSDDAIIVILPETSSEAVQGLVQKLVQSMESGWPDGLPVVGVNCGTSTWEKGDDVDRLVLRAVRATCEEVVP
jgi:GGDEF domain-containing protein